MRFVLLLGAAAIALTAGFMALQWSNKQMVAPKADVEVSAKAVDVSTVQVLVARKKIPAGSVITTAMLDQQPWPDHLVLDGFVTGDVKSSGIVGKVTRSMIQLREPILLSKLADTDQPGFLASSLGVGMRAITIATDAVTGIAGYIFAGDRVDVLFVHNLASQSNSTAPTTSEVLAANVRVLAINVREPGVGDALTSAVASSGGAPSTITVEVDQAMAQKIRLAEKVGSLSFSLRSLTDRKKQAAVVPEYLENLSQATAGGRGAGDAPVRIIRGAGPEDTPVAPAQPSAGGGLGGLFGNILGR